MERFYKFLIMYMIILVSADLLISYVHADDDPHFKNLKAQNNIVNEDQIIICVIKANGIVNDGYICHLYDTKQLDFYQDSTDGTFFNTNDSFDIVIKP